MCVHLVRKEETDQMESDLEHRKCIILFNPVFISYKCMGCMSSFSVNTVNGSLVVGDMRGEHNHPCTQEYMMVDHSRRNLSGMQRVIVDIVECMISTFELRNTVLIEFGKYVSRQDVVKLKQKMTASTHICNTIALSS
uniref:Uncharacterized protein n=1 Tax=Trichobilharzia regenti TaxID=157069 RepID=A0AA85IR07_TRIRE|nr:unnamed protein product [Trichobilharzia regenti]